MSIITLPTDLFVGEFGIEQLRYDTMDVSEETGSADTRLKGPPRWKVSLGSGDDITQAQAARWKALGLKLRGGVNHLALHDLNNPVPRGTARGQLTLSAPLSKGGVQLSLQGAYGTNMFRGPGFEFDSNADGLCDGWTAYSNGTAGTVTYVKDATTALGSGTSQTVNASNLGTSSLDRAGIYQDVLYTGRAGEPITFSANLWGNANQQARVYIQFYKLGVPVSGTMDLTVTLTNAWQRYAVTGVADADFDQMQSFIWQTSRPTTGPAVLHIDKVQLEVGSSATTYTDTPTLYQGDWLQVGTGVGSSQLFMVMDDMSFNELGVGTVNVEPPSRLTVSSSTVVTWNKPVAYYKRVGGDSFGWHAKAGSLLEGGFMMNDLVEQWS